MCEKMGANRSLEPTGRLGKRPSFAGSANSSARPPGRPTVSAAPSYAVTRSMIAGCTSRSKSA